MECPKCGRENDNKMSFCGYCGTPLNNNGSQEVVVPQDFKFQDEDGDGIPDDLPKELKLVKNGPDKTQEVKDEIKDFDDLVKITKEEEKPEELVKIKEETPKEKKITKKESSEKMDLKKTTELILMIILVILFIIVLFGTLKERGIL